MLFLKANTLGIKEHAEVFVALKAGIILRSLLYILLNIHARTHKRRIDRPDL